MPSLKAIIHILIAFCLLAATNTISYETTAGRVLDIFRPDPYDVETPGSGFTDWHDTFCRRHRAWDVLRLVVFFGIAVLSLLVVVLCEKWRAVRAKRIPGLDVAIEYRGRTGEWPHWMREQEVEKELEVKRDTRYCHLSDEVIFVCGKGGGFEWVVAGDFEATIARRRGLSREFA
jgi:hypothetical protein